MSQVAPIPPTYHHKTTRLTHRDAHTLLSTFLTLAENSPAYRPDSTLTERGPVSSSAADGNLTLGYLKRLLKGIEGKRVGGDDVLDGLDGEGTDNESDTSKRKRKDGYNGGVQVGDEEEAGSSPHSRKRLRNKRAHINPEQESQPQTPMSQASGWEDKSTYELSRPTHDLDVKNEDRNPTSNLEQPITIQEEREMMEVEVEGEMVDSRFVDADGETGQIEETVGLSKEERKRRKKERRKEEKRKKEGERKAKQ